MGTPETTHKTHGILNQHLYWVKPCPERIIYQTGDYFSMGAVGGSAFPFLKGLYNSPKGHRLIGASQAVRLNAPRVGGRFAVWGGLISAFECTLVYARQKEDPWNSVAAGAATGGLLYMRQGLRAASRYAFIGGGILALFEGFVFMFDKAWSDLRYEVDVMEYSRLCEEAVNRNKEEVVRRCRRPSS